MFFSFQNFILLDALGLYILLRWSYLFNRYNGNGFFWKK